MSVKVAHSVLVDGFWSTAPSDLKHGAVNSRQTSTAAHRQSKGSSSCCLPHLALDSRRSKHWDNPRDGFCFVSSNATSTGR